MQCTSEYCCVQQYCVRPFLMQDKETTTFSIHPSLFPRIIYCGLDFIIVCLLVNSLVNILYF